MKLIEVAFASKLHLVILFISFMSMVFVSYICLDGHLFFFYNYYSNTNLTIKINFLMFLFYYSNKNHMITNSCLILQTHYIQNTHYICTFFFFFSNSIHREWFCWLNQSAWRLKCGYLQTPTMIQKQISLV